MPIQDRGCTRSERSPLVVIAGVTLLIASSSIAGAEHHQALVRPVSTTPATVQADGLRPSGTMATPTSVALQVARVPGSPDDVSLQWSPGTSPYTLYRSYTVPIGGSESVQVGSVTSFNLTMRTSPGNIAFFRISEGVSGLPQATVVSPADGTSIATPSATVTGTVNGTVTRVWVNKTGATLNGNNFTATPVLLVIGGNTLYPTALTQDENITVTTTQVTRNTSNVPSTITINSPATGSQVADVTPVFDVSIDDAGLFDIGTFSAYLDGVDTTGSFTKTPASGTTTHGTATWQPPDTVSAALKPGMHTFQVTVKDAAGFTNTATSTFRVTGPTISFLQPDGSLYIYGNGFGTASNTTVVFTGASTSTFASISATLITLAVPSGATDGPLYVEVDGVASEPVYFDRSFPGLVVDAAGVAIDTQDRVYYFDYSDLRRVRRIPQIGGSVADFFTVSASEQITGIVFDRTRTTLYVVTRGSPSYVGSSYTYLTGRIYSIDLNGNWVLRKTLLQDPVNSGPYSDPGGIDVVGSVAYVTAFRPDVDKVILAVDLNTGATSPLLSYPLSGVVDSDVKLDSAGNIYSLRYDGSGSRIHKNSGLIYNLKNVGALHIDCLDRVWFTDFANGGVFDGGAYRLQGVNSATPIATGTSPQSVWGIDADSTGNIFIGSPDFGIIKITTQLSACQKDFVVTVTGDADKILADYDPVQSIETPNSQFTVLTACLGEATIPRSSANRVVWTYETDPSGITNFGSFDGSAPFTAEPGYTLDLNGEQGRSSYDGSGCSKVRFHPTDSPGDNFRVTALAETLVGNASARSRIMTVWKRLHVELDSMGTVIGPLDPQGDDALIGDVPDPDPGLLVSAFKPAYIDVILSATQHDTPSVSFDAHVPNSDLDPDTQQQAEMQMQAAFPTIRGSSSVNGDWWAYIQGGYEASIELDNDPETELAMVGATAGYWGKASLVYSETVRDAAPDLGVDDAYLLRMYLLHEIGHQFGMHDLQSPLNVMTVTVEGGPPLIAVPYFVPAQILMLRCREGTAGCPPPSNLP